MYKLFLSLVLLISMGSAFAQAELYLGGEFVGGVLGGSDFNTDLLKQRNYSPTLGGVINGSVRFYDKISLELGIGQHYSRVRMVDNDFEEQADDFSINILDI